jgi:hypothetical protein
MFLGAHVRRVTGRENIHVWMGECHVHAGIDPEHINLQRAAHPGAEFLIHPECGCATPVVEAVSAGAIDARDVHILSTEGMIKRPSQSPADEFIVATELGILHRLRRENPTKTFFAANDRAQCAYMKVTTLPKVLRSLETLTYEITVPDDVAARARRLHRAHGRHRRPGRRPRALPLPHFGRGSRRMTTPPLGPRDSNPGDLPDFGFLGGRLGDQLRGSAGSGAATRRDPSDVRPSAESGNADSRRARRAIGAAPTAAPRVVWGRTRTSRAC